MINIAPFKKRGQEDQDKTTDEVRVRFTPPIRKEEF
jgi:hypothetical protein